MIVIRFVGILRLASGNVHDEFGQLGRIARALRVLWHEAIMGHNAPAASTAPIFKCAHYR
jgi:hypothetical protein